MPINSRRAADRVVNRLEAIGIDEKVSGEESHTAKLVRMIVESVLQEIISSGEVIIINLPVQTPMGPGVGNGKGTII